MLGRRSTWSELVTFRAWLPAQISATPGCRNRRTQAGQRRSRQQRDLRPRQDSTITRHKRHRRRRPADRPSTRRLRREPIWRRPAQQRRTWLGIHASRRKRSRPTPHLTMRNAIPRRPTRPQTTQPSTPRQRSSARESLPRPQAIRRPLRPMAGATRIKRQQRPASRPTRSRRRREE